MSSRKVRLQQMARGGDRRAEAARKLADNPERFLSTVQIGITLIGILAGAFGGITIAGGLAVYLKDIPWIHPYHQAVALALVVLTITYLSIVLGEIVPVAGPDPSGTHCPGYGLPVSSDRSNRTAGRSWPQPVI